MSDGFLHPADAQVIAGRIIDLADRVKLGNAVAPGARAKVQIEIDDTVFDLTMTVSGLNDEDDEE